MVDNKTTYSVPEWDFSSEKEDKPVLEERKEFPVDDETRYVVEKWIFPISNDEVMVKTVAYYQEHTWRILDSYNFNNFGDACDWVGGQVDKERMGAKK